ncbi:hypothetical protein [Paenibacillus sp. YPG26]|uniref:hypothetical protein n=1 Tax=Paenibacillus sp. YPG26 TaxID=2878915 RepID=UPI00203BA7BF|nr:hypothetical protein [Paenibacillus sp. YPG26]USB31688.1 hypothetical protein LDO05_10005 [Paenibacillus sp. YPG26]
MLIRPTAASFWRKMIAIFMTLVGISVVWIHEPLNAAQAEAPGSSFNLEFSKNVYEVKLGEKINAILYSKGNNGYEDVTVASNLVSDNPHIAKIDNFGTIEGINPGTIYIYGYNPVRMKMARAEVRVVGDPPADLELNFDSDEYSVVPERPLEFRVTAKGKDGVVRDVTSDAILSTYSYHIVLFSIHDGMYELYSSVPGTTTITAMYQGKVATAHVTSFKHNYKFTVDSEEYSLMPGERLDMRFSIIQPNGSNEMVDPRQEFVQTYSDNFNVAWVDRNTGEIVAVGPGEATITVSYKGRAATAKVIVYPRIRSLSLD